MNPSININISRSLSASALSSVGDAESKDLLSPTDVDHREDIDSELDLEPDLKVSHFMANDAFVGELHPGSKAPEKGFLEQHKALGVFLIGAAALLTVVLAVGLPVGGILGGIVLFPTAAGGVLVGLTVAGLLTGTIFLPAFGAGCLTGVLIYKTFEGHFRMSEATNILSQKLRQSLEPQEARAKARTAKEIFRGLGTVRNSPGGNSRSVAEVDFLVKYSQLPEDLKRDLLARFFTERTKGTEAPATLLKIEEREFESTQKLHSGLLDTLSTRLRIDRTDIPQKERNESWGDYYKDIFAIVRENRFYQALPQERRNEIEALSAHPATQLFHAAQDLQAVEEAVRDGATTVLQEQVLDAVTATRTEQVASGAEAIKQWMNSDGGQKAINDRLIALAISRTYVPIIAHTPLPAH